MKKLLSILASTTVTVSGVTNVVACNTQKKNLRENMRFKDVKYYQELLAGATYSYSSDNSIQYIKLGDSTWEIPRKRGEDLLELNAFSETALRPIEMPEKIDVYDTYETALFLATAESELPEERYYNDKDKRFNINDDRLLRESAMIKGSVEIKEENGNQSKNLYFQVYQASILETIAYSLSRVFGENMRIYDSEKSAYEIEEPDKFDLKDLLLNSGPNKFKLFDEKYNKNAEQWINFYKNEITLINPYYSKDSKKMQTIGWQDTEVDITGFSFVPKIIDRPNYIEPILLAKTIYVINK